MTTATATLRVLVVWPKDAYDTQTCAAYPRCKTKLSDLDVIVTTGVTAVAHHVQCLPARARVDLPPPSDDDQRCWYASGTPAACPFPIADHNLCADHHGQLCRDGRKPRRR